MKNQVLEQDRVQDTFDLFNSSGVCLFCQQKLIYDRLAMLVRSRTVLEAGCGVGLGTVLMERTAKYVMGTDKSERNIRFARCLYPWMNFGVWDLNEPTALRARVVVCIEVIEHVADPSIAIAHLLEAATEEGWISTPNGNGKQMPPENPYHVCEYTPHEVLSWLPPGSQIISPVDWSLLSPDTLVDPLVYKVSL
jgi:2-polyprenyl-3-methyl-5-hydroxy-6-metoxy-1,4-benzoquinol methylase